MHSSQTLILDRSSGSDEPLSNPSTLVFIDGAIADSDSLIQGVLPGVEVVRLTADQDGIEQITLALSDRHAVGAVHWVTHGSPGRVQSGSTELSLNTLDQYAGSIGQWQRALLPQAHLVLYGCEVASNQQGRDLIQQLSRLTGAGVAASDDPTGNAALGGDWQWEVQTAPMEVQPAFAPAVLAAYPHLLAAIRVNDAITDEGDSGATDLTFTVSLDAPAPAEGVTVDFSILGSSATVGSDFTGPASGTLTFAAGETTQTVTVSVLGDIANEADETFFVQLSNPSANATLADNRGVGLILNDDLPPSLSISDAVIAEGTGGASTAEFTLTLSAPSTQYIEVKSATADGTAIAGTDYTSVPLTTVIFSPGETSKTLSVPVSSDSLYEADETFLVNLSSAVNATIAKTQGTATLTNDDTAPSLSIADVTVTETDSGTTNATLTVALSAVSGRDVSVDWATADDSAINGQDYDPVSGTLTILAGQTTGTLIVPIRGDQSYESAESLRVNLTNPVQATLGDSQATVNITDNDPQPALTITDLTLNEGDSGTTVATVTVSLSGNTSQPVTVNYATADDKAIAGEDYTAASGTLTFNPGVITQQISVTLSGDGTYEPDESFLINLTAAAGATLTDAQAIVTLTNDDAAPTVSIADATVAEGSPARFNLSLSRPSSTPITVNYTLADGTATQGSDYTAATGTVTFAPNTTVQTIDVVTVDDATDEPDETFLVNLSSSDAGVADAQAVGTLTDNDNPPSISVSDISIAEGNSSHSATVTVTLSNPSTSLITVNYATADNTAIQDSDYTSTTGTLTFQPGETTATFTVPILGDRLSESNEAFEVNLSGATNATISDAQAIVTLLDDDPSVYLAISDANVLEGNSGTTTINFTVGLSGPSTQTITVDYGTQDGTATAANSDYVAISNTSLTFNPGETSKVVAVTVRGDVQVEPNETFTVKLSNPSSNVAIVDDQGTGTIRTDDTTPNVLVSDVTVVEGNQGTTANFTLTLSTASAQTVTVDYATADGSATVADNDYSNTSGTLTFASGETSKAVSVQVKGDTRVEADELFFLLLSNATNAVIVQDRGTATLTNDDTFSPPSNPPAPTPTPTPTPTSGPMQGTDNSDVLLGDEFSNVIRGFDGDDIIRGFAGNDSLDGGAGNDQVYGGRNDDRLWGREGNDLLVGRRGNDQLFGGNGKDELYGGGGNDQLVGGRDNDLLRGGSGKDRFIFERKDEGMDTIVDFSVRQDMIMVVQRGFKPLAGKFRNGLIDPDQFRLGAKALDRSDRFCYQRQTGMLWFDADGSGGGQAVRLAQISTKVGLSYRNIGVI